MLGGLPFPHERPCFQWRAASLTYYTIINNSRNQVKKK